MKHISSLLLLCLFSMCAGAQFYCAPTFDQGCAGWNTMSVIAGSIAWGDDADCTYSDHTELSTTVDLGEELAMTVENGVWCGCAVWVDLDNNEAFEEEENLYYQYVGGDPSYVYEFVITIPEGTSSGAHRMRVISPWGSDGFLSTNTNGFGPCGAYQYGNFDDFTINVTGSGIGMDELRKANAHLTASPNPTQGLVTVTMDDAAPVDRIAVWSTDGRLVQQKSFAERTVSAQVDLCELPIGMYMVQCFSESGVRTLQVARQ